MLKAIIGLIKSLNSNSHPGEIAHAVSIGVLLGLMPKDNALWYILFIFFAFVRINKAVYLLVILGMSLFAHTLDVYLDQIGYIVLTYEPAYPVYRFLLDIPFVAFTKFNNTVVMGSLVSGIILYIPVYIIARLLIKLWRSTIAPKIASSKLWSGFKNLPLIKKIFAISEEISGVVKR